MGRDIHVVLEKKNNGNWEFFDPGFEHFDDRHYPFFDFIEEITDPGCPEELNNQQLRSRIERWNDQNGIPHETQYFLWDTTEPCYQYGFGHITLEKLAEETKKLNTMWVSTEFMEKFLLLGGRLPEEMQVVKETFDDACGAVGVRVVDEDDLHLRDFLNTGISALRQIAAEHGLQEDELRLCIAFDC